MKTQKSPDNLRENASKCSICFDNTVEEASFCPEEATEQLKESGTNTVRLTDVEEEHSVKLTEKQKVERDKARKEKKKKARKKNFLPSPEKARENGILNAKEVNGNWRRISFYLMIANLFYSSQKELSSSKQQIPNNDWSKVAELFCCCSNKRNRRKSEGEEEEKNEFHIASNYVVIDQDEGGKKCSFKIGEHQFAVFFGGREKISVMYLDDEGIEDTEMSRIEIDLDTQKLYGGGNEMKLDQLKVEKSFSGSVENYGSYKLRVMQAQDSDSVIIMNFKSGFPIGFAFSVQFRTKAIAIRIGTVKSLGDCRYKIDENNEHYYSLVLNYNHKNSSQHQKILPR